MREQSGGILTPEREREREREREEKSGVRERIWRGRAGNATKKWIILTHE